MLAEHREPRILGRQRRVLMVDDHAVSRFLMCHVLATHGHHCKPAGTAIEALDSIDSFEPEIVILEWRLRDGNGRGLARQLRSRSAAHGRLLAVCVVSTADEPAGFVQEEQVDAYFTKPVPIGEVENWFGSDCRVPLPR